MAQEESKMKAMGRTAAEKGKKGFDWAWAKSSIVGVWGNKQAGKLGIEAFWPTEIPKECDKCARILWTFTANAREGTPALASNKDDPNHAKKTQKVLAKIPPKLIESAQGIAIFTVFRTGFGISGASGSGILIARDSPTSWGAPSGLLVHTIGFGFLIGLDVYDCCILLRTKKAVDAFAKPKVSLGAEMAIAAGPVGNGFVLDTGIELAPVLTYTKSKGLYGGLQLDGNIIIERNDENKRFYGRTIKAKEIINGGVPIPGAVAGLHAVLAAAEGKPYDPEDLPEQVDVSPSEAVGTEVDANGAVPSSSDPASRTSSSPIIIPDASTADREEEKIKPRTEVPAPPPRPPRRFVAPRPGSIVEGSRPTTPTQQLSSSFGSNVDLRRASTESSRLRGQSRYSMEAAR